MRHSGRVRFALSFLALDTELNKLSVDFVRKDLLLNKYGPTLERVSGDCLVPCITNSLCNPSLEFTRHVTAHAAYLSAHD